MTAETPQEASLSMGSCVTQGYKINDRKRFLLLCSGVYICIAISACYTFGVFSHYIKDRYKYNQDQITTISTVGTVIGYFTFPAGIVFDYFGPKVLIPAALVLSSTGYLLYGLTFLGYIKPSVAGFATYFSISYFGNSCFECGAIMPALLNFPMNRGEVVIIMKTFAGLGTTLITCIYTAFMPGRYTDFMFFLFALEICFGLVGWCFIRCPPFFFTQYEKKRITQEEIEARLSTMPAYYSQPASYKRIALGIGVVFCLLIYLTVVSICEAYLKISKSANIAIGVIAIIITCFFLFMLLPVKFLDGNDVPPPISDNHASLNQNQSTSENGKKDQVEPYPTEAVKDSTEPDKENRENQLDGQNNSPSTDKKEMQGVFGVRVSNDYAAMTLEQLRTRREELRVREPQYHNTFFRDLLVYDVWLIWWNNFCVWGAGITISANCSQIYDALVGKGNYQDSTNALYVAMIGVGSALGRITMGVFEIVRQKSSKDKKPLITAGLPVSSIATALGCLFFLIIPSSGLILPFMVSAFGNGYCWGNTAVTIRAMFSQEIGMHYNFCFFGGLLSIICLNRFAFGEIFTKEGHKMGEGDKCYGLRCIQTCLILIVCLNVSAAVGCFIVHLKFKRFCRKFHEENELEIEKINTIEQERLAISS